MKKYFKIFTVCTIGALAFNSCSDSWLGENYSDSVLTTIDDNTIKTKSDLVQNIKGLYSRVASSSGFGGEYLTYQELTADIGFVGVANSGYYVGTNGGTHINVEGAGSGLWSAFYNTIANCNFVLSYEGKVPEDEEATISAKKLFAHAKTIRAYNYMALLNLFSPNYGEGDQSLGVPYLTSFDVEQKLPRETVPYVVDQIIVDLNEALASMSDSSDTTPTEFNDRRNSFNEGAVKLLLARIYLYKKDYDKAATYAQEVVDDSSSTFVSSTELTTYFRIPGELHKETLFQIEYNTLSLHSIRDYWGSLGAYKQNWMSRNFWDLFPTTDPRKTSWYPVNASVNNLADDPKPVDVRKYISADRDLVQLRKSESIFILAEAQYHSNPAQALSTLKNWIVDYRDTAYNPTATGSGVLDEILRQKGFEFFLEGTRFSDLKRNNKDIVKYQTMNGAPLTTIPVGDRRFIWPIPLSEIQTNPNIAQAPGY